MTNKVVIIGSTNVDKILNVDVLLNREKHYIFKMLKKFMVAVKAQIKHLQLHAQMPKQLLFLRLELKETQISC